MTTVSLPSLNGINNNNIDTASLDAFPQDIPNDVTASNRKTNALSHKLNNILSSSFADTEIRDALRLLDSREDVLKSTGSFSKKTTSSSSTRNPATWDLKATSQKSVIDSNARIIADFSQVAAQLRHVGELIHNLNQTCDEMKKHIQAAKLETSPVLEEASTLMARQQETEQKQQLLNAFNKHFLVSDEDLTILSSSAAPLNDRFFEILERVKQVHKDCEVLLGFENQRLGLELMEQTSRHLDAGYRKLYTSIQADFRALDLEDPRMSGSIRRALRTLAERPAMFQNCLNFFAEAREAALMESFQSALTGSSMPGKSVAIEFSTHDPLRYIGDMLAWTHSAAISEKEALEGFFISDAEEITRGLKAGRTTEPWSRIDRMRPKKHKPVDKDQAIDKESQEDDSADEEEEEPVFDGPKALGDLIDRNLSSVCQTLQQRITITVHNSGDPVTIYKIFNLLNFYSGIFSKLLSPTAHITQTISQLETDTLNQFEETVEEEITSAATTGEGGNNTSSANDTNSQRNQPLDLSPPLFLVTTLKQFTDISRARGAQMTSSELERLFTAMISTSLAQCAEMATRYPTERQTTIFNTNYLCLVRGCLRSLTNVVPSMTIPLEKASREISMLRDALVNDLTAALLDESGVAAVLMQLDTLRLSIQQNSHDGHNGTAPFLAGPKLEAIHSELEQAAAQLDEFLGVGLMDAQESFRFVADKALAKQAVEEAIEKFCGEFDELETVLEAVDEEMDHQERKVEEEREDFVGGEKARTTEDEEDGGQRVRFRDLYPRSGAEVRALLS